MLTATGSPTAARPGGPDAWEFFFYNIGYSYVPGVESPIVGTLRAAVAHARAEAIALAADAYVLWEDDSEGADVWNEETKDYDTLPAMVALLVAPCVICPESVDPSERVRRCARKAYLHVLGSLSGITESDDPREQRDYRRVIEAELACEAYMVKS